VKRAGKSSLTISAKPVSVGAVSQPWIVRGERSGLQMRIATMESDWLCVRMKNFAKPIAFSIRKALMRQPISGKQGIDQPSICFFDAFGLKGGHSSER
jgi:hypothetical protein